MAAYGSESSRSDDALQTAGFGPTLMVLGDYPNGRQSWKFQCASDAVTLLVGQSATPLSFRKDRLPVISHIDHPYSPPSWPAAEPSRCACHTCPRARRRCDGRGVTSPLRGPCTATCASRRWSCRPPGSVSCRGPVRSAAACRSRTYLKGLLTGHRDGVDGASHRRARSSHPHCAPSHRNRRRGRNVPDRGLCDFRRS